LQHNPVPIGFIYVQLPNQPDPKSLWPTVEWKNVTSDYAGLFFRAEGRGSEAFGKAQDENAPRLTGVWNDWFTPVNYVANISANSDWNKPVSTGPALGSDYKDLHWGLRFRVSSGEIRPRNQAVRIWKRTN